MILLILSNYHQWDSMQIYPNISELSKWMFISFKWFWDNNHPFGTDWIAGNKIPVRQSQEQVFLCPLLFSTLSGWCQQFILLVIVGFGFCKALSGEPLVSDESSEAFGCLHSELLKNRLLCVHIISIPVFVGGDRHRSAASTSEHDFRGGEIRAMEDTVGRRPEEMRKGFVNVVMPKA